MTTLVLGAVGAAAGFAMGGPFGASIGWALGAAAGSYLFPGPAQQGPRLTDLRLQGSSYGAFEPIPYGTVRLAGNVIWQTDLREHEHTSGGKGGGGPKAETFSYSASFDVGICEAPVAELRKIWAYGRLIYDTGGADVGSDVPITFYDGNEAQDVDPIEEAETGVGLTPAYRDLARGVLNDWDLSQFSNQIPALEWLVATKGRTPVAIRLVKSNDHYGTNYWPGNQVIDAWTTDLGDDTPLAEPSAVSDAPRHLYMEGGPVWLFGSVAYFVTDPFILGNGFVIEKLWLTPHYVVTNNPTQWPAVSAVQPFVGGDGVVGGTNFADAVGITHGEYVVAATTTQDRRTLFLFTSDSNAGDVNHWYKIKGDDTPLVVDQGDVVPPVGAPIFGYGSFVDRNSPPSNGPFSGVSVAERNEQYIWSYYGQHNIAAPGPPWEGGSIQVFKIDQNTKNLAHDDSAGYGFYSPQGDCLPSIFCFRDGYIGTIGHVSGLPTDWNQTALWSRLGPAGQITLAEIVADQCERCGLTSGQYDVSQLTDIVDGYLISQQMTGRAAIEALMPVYFFDAVESDGKIKFIKRGQGTVFAIPDDDLAAHDDGSELPAKLSFVRAQEVDLPAFAAIVYPNRESDYQLGTQSSQRMATASELTTTVQTTVVLSNTRAKQIVDAWLYNAWLERDVYTFFTSRKYAKYEPTDIAVVQGGRLRITKVRRSGNVLEWTAVPSYNPVFAQAGVAGTPDGQTSPPTVPGAQATLLTLLDIPYIADPMRQHVYWAAMQGAERRDWVGAALMKSIDGGASYGELSRNTVPDSIGLAASALADWSGGNVFDEQHSVTVVMQPGAGSLESYTRLAVLNGAGEYLLGDEILRAKNAVLIAERTYQLSGLLRGRRGTEWAMAGHAAGEIFVALPAKTELAAIYAEYGASRQYKAVTLGRALSTAPPVAFANTGRAVKCWAPVHLGGGRDAAGNLTLKCHRRARINNAWLNGIDVPLGEASEQYRFTIYADGSFAAVLDIVTDFAPTTSYSAAQQTVVFGSPQATIYWGVQQLGALGYGYEARSAA